VFHFEPIFHFFKYVINIIISAAVQNLYWTH